MAQRTETSAETVERLVDRAGMAAARGDADMAILMARAIIGQLSDPAVNGDNDCCSATHAVAIMEVSAVLSRIAGAARA